jgi:glycosyltransferase involved in cell wall biosynthesis
MRDRSTKTIGVFLGTSQRNGGMFQYSQSILDALSLLVDQKKFQIKIAYIHDDWKFLEENSNFQVRKMVAGSFGMWLSMVMLATLIPSKLVRRFLCRLNPLNNQLKKCDCDIWIFPAQDAIGYQIDLKSLVTVHDLMHRYERGFPEVEKGFRYLIREHRFKNLTKHGLGVLVDSRVGKNQLLNCYSIDDSRIFPLPYVPQSIIASTNSNVTDYIKSYNLPEKFLFYPAQFWAHKNHRALIRATCKLIQDGIDVHLVLTGGFAHEYQNLVDYVHKMKLTKNILFVGFVSDLELSYLYRAARGMIMPTYFGPTNIPPMEANQYGCPVAVSGIYAMPEQLGEGALYFDQTSEESIADAIKKLWTDDVLCEKLVHAGYKNCQLWNLECFKEQLEVIINNVSSKY